ncbi:MAG: methylmalonyl-CoA epimerase [Candidatus Bathyarchaeia archaeon]|jgi:methylmalonyl-CoA/ethylmalonyl-CoA epimerase
MSYKIDHIGVAVRSLPETIQFLEQTFSLKPIKIVETATMKGAFILIGDSEIELIEPTDPSISIAKFIAKNGEGIHHISIRVNQLENVLQELKKKGIKLIDEKPRIGIHGTKIAFLNPESTKGILIELCQAET